MRGRGIGKPLKFRFCQISSRSWHFDKVVSVGDSVWTHSVGRFGVEKGDGISELVSFSFFGDNGLVGGGSGLVQCLYGGRVRHISFVGIALEIKMTSPNFLFFVQIANVTYVYRN